MVGYVKLASINVCISLCRLIFFLATCQSTHGSVSTRATRATRAFTCFPPQPTSQQKWSEQKGVLCGTILTKKEIRIFANYAVQHWNIRAVPVQCRRTGCVGVWSVPKGPIFQIMTATLYIIPLITRLLANTKKKSHVVCLFTMYLLPFRRSQCFSAEK